MRGVALIIAVAACAPGAGVTASPSPPGPAPLPAAGLVAPGEQMVWEVFWQGLAIGRADLAVDAAGVRASFATGRLARAVANVRYELATTLVDRTARHAVEQVNAAARTEIAIEGAHYAIAGGGRGEVPGGTGLHTLTSGLGAVRAWAAPGAGPAYAWMIVDGGLYRLDVAAPVSEALDGQATLRIDGVVRALDPAGDTADLTLWLSARADRTPLRIVVSARGERIVAQLAETTLEGQR